jgi:hypothetical protein
MFTSNPFANLTGILSPAVMQAYVALMMLAVLGGTLADVIHKGSGKYFAQYRERMKARAERRLGGADKAGFALKTLMFEVASAGEFCNPQRRISHLLMFYGFLSYLVTTCVMVFFYAGEPGPAVLPLVWNVGALMVVIGGYWFFFLIRVDVVHDGRSPFHLVRADLFIVSLLASVSFALVWEIVQAGAPSTASNILLGIYVFVSTVLFVSVPWSKFAHMFYKPAMAYQRRVEEADGSSSLPMPARPKGGI